MNLEKKVKSLPSCPGVYLMKDSLDSIIYVGKSKNLKNRVRSYFQNSKSHSPKVIKLVKNLADFEYIVTDTEFEAFLLECKLIKKIKPIYNKQMKSPKSYSYIKITQDKRYPNIEISNETSKNGSNFYFGPYTSKNTTERALQGIKEYYKISCNTNLRNNSSCINYSLGLCIGMCLDGDKQKLYRIIINKIIELLNGTDLSIFDEMKYIMNNASAKFNFETAAKYRDYINSINYLIDKANIVKFTEENKNIALLEYLNNSTFKFFLIKGNKVLFKEKYLINDINLEDLKSSLKNNILSYFNDKASKDLIEIGRDEIDESQIIYTYLSNNLNNCKHIILSEELLDTSGNSANLNNLLNKLLGK